MLAALDVKLLRLLRTRGHAAPVERAVRAYAAAGEHGLLWHGIAAAGVVLDGRQRVVYLRAMAVTLAALAANSAVKRLVQRARPVLGEELEPLVTTISGRSYPSAHACTSFAAARALSPALSPRLLYSAAVLMALSRPYLGVHYPSDIAAGALLGDALERLA